MSDVRAFPRLSLSCDIEFNYLSGSNPSQISNTKTSDTVRSKTKDVSRGGICLITSTPLIKGAILSLKFTLQKQGKPIEAKGRVAWTQAFAIGNQMGYDNGIEFIEMSDSDKALVEKYIKSIFPT